MFKSKLIILLPVVLSSCALFKDPPPPGIQVQIQKVEVPVAVPCKATVPAVPQYNFDKLTVDKDIFVKDQALLADRLLHLGYEKELLAALESCK